MVGCLTWSRDCIGRMTLLRLAALDERKKRIAVAEGGENGHLRCRLLFELY